jgi:hypothetical protein
MQISIPTMGRVGLSQQITLREFMDYSQYRPWLVCPYNEVAAHKKYWPRVIGCPAKGIGPTRQWILDNTNARICVMVDDDMYFSYRPDPENVKLERCTNLNPMIRLIAQSVADGYYHGGVSARQGNNHMDFSTPRRGTLDRGAVFVDCIRSYNFHFFDVPAIRKLGMRFNPEQHVMEDFRFILDMLTKGYPNRVIYSYCWNQRGSGTVGGCSSYRTAELQAASARKLGEAYPKFVKVVTKAAKTAANWKGMKERVDVNVQWLKAYESAKVKHAPACS